MSGIEFLLDTNMVIGLLKGHTAAIALAEQPDVSHAISTRIFARRDFFLHGGD